ncbi:hypothetical protein FB157_110169 [Streptomyces sp. BK340]|nr:hypothetical protein FB157_110169 [Streptomyces sp. BK340]
MSDVTTTDLYEVTMALSCLREDMRAPATFSLFARDLPPGRGFLVAAGLEPVPVRAIRSQALEEQTARVRADIEHRMLSGVTPLSPRTPRDLRLRRAHADRWARRA